MEHKRLTIFAGHYGSGKTNIAVNYATLLAGEGKQVCIADMDIVNPYFRTADSRARLEQSGVQLIASQFANSNVDLPALPAETYRLVQDHGTYGVADVGGDDRGAYALGRYVPYIKEENDYRMAFVVNFLRPLTTTAGEALEVMREIEAACGLEFTCIVNNTNLGWETTREILDDSRGQLDELCRLSGLPLWLTAAEERLAPQLEQPVLSLKLQEKYFDITNETGGEHNGKAYVQK